MIDERKNTSVSRSHLLACWRVYVQNLPKIRESANWEHKLPVPFRSITITLFFVLCAENSGRFRVYQGVASRHHGADFLYSFPLLLPPSFDEQERYARLKPRQLTSANLRAKSDRNVLALLTPIKSLSWTRISCGRFAGFYEHSNSGLRKYS